MSSEFGENSKQKKNHFDHGHLEFRTYLEFG